MERTELHRRVWRILYRAVDRPLHRLYALESEPCAVEGPCIVISNHVTDMDPFLVAMSFPHKQLYYVASEHIFRIPVASKVIETLLDPIARKNSSDRSGRDRQPWRCRRRGPGLRRS